MDTQSGTHRIFQSSPTPPAVEDEASLRGRGGGSARGHSAGPGRSGDRKEARNPAGYHHTSNHSNYPESGAFFESRTEHDDRRDSRSGGYTPQRSKHPYDGHHSRRDDEPRFHINQERASQIHIQEPALQIPTSPLESTPRSQRIDHRIRNQRVGDPTVVPNRPCRCGGYHWSMYCPMRSQRGRSSVAQEPRTYQPPTESRYPPYFGDDEPDDGPSNGHDGPDGPQRKRRRFDETNGNPYNHLRGGHTQLSDDVPVKSEPMVEAEIVVANAPPHLAATQWSINSNPPPANDVQPRRVVEVTPQPRPPQIWPFVGVPPQPRPVVESWPVVEPRPVVESRPVIEAAPVPPRPKADPPLNDARLVNALDTLLTQHHALQNIRSTIPTSTPVRNPVHTAEPIVQVPSRNAQRRDSERAEKPVEVDSDDISSSSSESDFETTDVEKINLKLEKYRSHFLLHSEKARQASKKMSRLTKCLAKAASSVVSTPVASTPAVRTPTVSEAPVGPIDVQETAKKKKRSRGPRGHSKGGKPSGEESEDTPAAPTPLPHETNGNRVEDQILNTTWQPKSSDTLDVLYGLNIVKGGDLGRKPRSLLLPREGMAHSLRETVITSTLDGNLHLFNRKSKEAMCSIRHAELRNYWAEDMAWVAPDILAVAAAPSGSAQNGVRDGTVVPHQIALLYDCSVKKSKFTYRLQHLVHNMPHDRGPSIIYPFSNNNNRVHWLTGGMDKKLILWSFDGPFAGDLDGSNYTRVNHISVHTEHTSAIQGIYYNPHSEILYTGGQDSRLVGWSLTNQRNTLPTERVDGRIRDITGIPTQPHLMLVGFSTITKQLRLWDERVNKFVLEFGMGDAADDATRYMHPDVHHGGYLVSMGSTRAGRIGIWDMRHVGVERAPTQQIDVGHTKRVLVAKFDVWRKRETLISVASDNSLIFADYLRRGDVRVDGVAG
ncbi:uncharacterized protein EV422DRAFT_518775 [Fimicolochytrium jonesii]|uniref:uncharacterized protein n=1 Tax=Fimicolochytrium jonesii TaxID=1396493 RepID=UPI0022FDC7DD|nr:uncharacterized protein EV422DRAFT_518775 [Fimicolochytrium jonesii]KAI8824064.1 hypothetical protein EV422DRAFT_518775 [Fimicolochytrium jonesii]